MKINIDGGQYRTFAHMIALNNLVDVITGYWQNELKELADNRVKLSKPVTAMIQKFMVSLNNSVLEQKEIYIETITTIASEHKYEVDEHTTVQLADDELAIILQQTADDTKENE